MFVDFVIQHVLRMRHIVISVPARLHNIFPSYLVNGMIFEIATEHKICVCAFSTTFVWNTSHSKNNWAKYDKQDRQCTYNVTLKRIRATIVAVEKP
jgi:hypothetical protein